MKKIQPTIFSSSVKCLPRLKVLHLIAAPKIGGAEKLLLTLIANIDFEYFDCSLVVFVDSRTANNDFYNEAKKCGANLYPVFIHNPYDISQLTQLYKILITLRPDVIHTHGYKTNILGFLMSRRFKVPIVATVHGWLHSNRKITQIYNHLSLCLLRRFDQVIAVSSQIEKVLLQRHLPTYRLVTLRNVPSTNNRFEVDRSVIIDNFSLDPKVKFIGFVGRLEHVKGCEFFIEAAKQVLIRFSDVQFLIAGEGPELEKLKALVAEEGLSHKVKFLGFLDNPGVLFQLLDLYVLPSLDEGIPLSLLEAMHADVPVVASSVGGVPEVITDGINGLLVPPGKSQFLTEAICLCLGDQDGASRRVREARKTIDRQFNVDCWIESLQKLYVNLKADRLDL